MLPLSILDVLAPIGGGAAAGVTHGTFLAVPPTVGNTAQTNAVNVVPGTHRYNTRVKCFIETQVNNF